jgi:hypothetical protein
LCSFEKISNNRHAKYRINVLCSSNVAHPNSIDKIKKVSVDQTAVTSKTATQVLFVKQKHEN